MKENLEQYATALSDKQALIYKLTHKQEPYYHTVMVEVKHRPKLVFGIKDHPYYTWEPEVRFNEELFGQHLASADIAINSYQERINQAQSALQKELISTTKEKDNQVQIVESLKNQCSDYQNRYNQTKEEINILTGKLVPWQEQDAKLENKINQTISRIESLSHVVEVSENPVSDIEPIMRSISEQQRAFFLMQAWGKDDADSKEIVAAIKSIGFDAAYIDGQDRTLLHLAAELNDFVLLDLTVKKKSSCIEDKTLLQYSAIHSNQDFIAKLLSYSADYSHGLLFIVNKNDNQSLQKLLNIKPELVKLIENSGLYNALKNEYFEIASLLIKYGIEIDKTLEVAIATNAHDIINSCFKLDSELINKTKLSTQTLLNYAVGSDNRELALIIEEYIAKNMTNSLNLPVFQDNYEQASLLGVGYDSNESLSDY